MKSTKIKVIALCLLTFVFLSAALFGCAIPNEPNNSNEQLPTVKKVEGENLTNSQTPLVKWQGRYELTEYRGVQMVMAYHTASGFTVDFYGTELKATFFHQASLTGGSDIYYQVAVDDELLPTTNKERVICLPDSKMTQTVTLVSGLQKGKHSVTCLKTSEPSDALTGVIDISTDGGLYERKAEEDQKTKFMFICASGGSGYGSLVCTSTNKIQRTRANSSSLHSFNYLTARMFDADVMYVAQAGWGLAFPATKSIAKVFDYTGILGYNENESLRNSVNGAQTTALWNHEQWAPDVIILNIGGNDTKQSSFDIATYKQTVASFVQKLHTLYPNAKMLWTHTNSKAGTYAIQALTSTGIIAEGYVKSAVIPQVADDNTYGASAHNSFKTHVDTADILAGYLETFGFAPVRQNVVYDDYLQFITTD
ncbi:MAG: SGNH/GDSL hydrolase family protein [Candidatus Fimimonas sp.]